jgi:hypothetical protein
MKSPAGKRNARLTRTPVGKAAVAAMMRERPSPIDDEMPDALDLAPTEAPTAPVVAQAQPTVARQLAVELASSAAPEPKLVTPTYAQVVAKKAPIISPAPPPVIAAQVTAPAGWESLAHVKNMEVLDCVFMNIDPSGNRLECFVTAARPSSGRHCKAAGIARYQHCQAAGANGSRSECDGHCVRRLVGRRCRHAFANRSPAWYAN